MQETLHIFCKRSSSQQSVRWLFDRWRESWAFA